jgi:head-tail adaptor
VDAGKLRERIKIQRKGQTKNPATGGLQEGWTTVADNLSAHLASINGRESVINGVLTGISFFDITIRYRDDLKPSDQVIWLSAGDRELNILSAEDRLGTRQWTVIQASTQAPQGA